MPRISKTTINTALVLSLFPIYRLWHFYGPEKISPWLQKGFYFPIEAWWYYKFLSESLAWVIFAFVGLRLARMRMWLEMAMFVHFIYRIYDLLMFFYNFNRSEDYVIAYSAGGLLAFGFYLYRKQVLNLKGLQDFFRHKIEKAY